MRFANILLSLLLVAVLVLATANSARAQGKAVTMNGYVIDSACAFIKNLKKPLSVDCAIACARAGSPLVLLADDGTVYWPISDAMPATGQNDRLIKFAGQRVTASGKVYDKGGSRAIVLEKIAGAPASK